MGNSSNNLVDSDTIVLPVLLVSYLINRNNRTGITVQHTSSDLQIVRTVYHLSNHLFSGIRDREISD